MNLIKNFLIMFGIAFLCNGLAYGADEPSAPLANESEDAAFKEDKFAKDVITAMKVAFSNIEHLHPLIDDELAGMFIEKWVSSDIYNKEKDLTPEQITFIATEAAEGEEAKYLAKTRSVVSTIGDDDDSSIPESVAHEPLVLDDLKPDDYDNLFLLEQELLSRDVKYAELIEMSMDQKKDLLNNYFIDGVISDTYFDYTELPYDGVISDISFDYTKLPDDDDYTLLTSASKKVNESNLVQLEKFLLENLHLDKDNYEFLINSNFETKLELFELIAK